MDILDVLTQVSLNHPLMIMLYRKSYTYITILVVKKDKFYELYVSDEKLDVDNYSGLYDINDYEDIRAVMYTRIDSIISRYKKLL